MGAINGTITFMRFRVDGDEAQPARLLKAVDLRRFLPLSPIGDVMESAGWVPSMAPFDDEITIDREHLFFGERIVITYREDAYKVPRPLLKRETKKRVDQIVREENKDPESIGRNFIKAVEQSVLTELKARSFPKTKLVECVWTPKRQELRIFGKGLIATERIASLFERTFSVKIELAAPAVRALAIIGDNDKNFAAMARLTPSLNTFGGAGE